MLHNQDWSTVDLETLAADALPVTSYKPRGDQARYDRDYTHWGEDKELAARDHYRVAWRAMANNVAERTLIPAIIPPGVAHIHGVGSMGMPEGTAAELVLTAGTLSSLLCDLAVRAVPKSAISPNVIRRLPRVGEELQASLILRVLRLNCLTDAYADLWSELSPLIVTPDMWAGGIAYADRANLDATQAAWSPETPLRRAADRRQAAVEIDALIAVALGVTADELCTVYRTQFPVLYGYDRNTYHYDANGRIVPSVFLTVWRSKGDGVTEEERTATNPSGNTYTYELPFVTLDREADMRQAYAHFDQVLAERGGA